MKHTIPSLHSPFSCFMHQQPATIFGKLCVGLQQYSRNYAFGVVMLELITGKDDVFVQESNKILLSAAAASIMRGEDAETKLGFLINPPGLAENKGRVYAARMANLSLTCLAQDPVRRPSMAEVVTALWKIQVDVQKSASMYFESPSDQATTFSFSEISLE